VKQVPDATDIRFDPITNNLIREGIPSIVNPHDLHAVESAVQLKEKFGGYVTAISMGPMQAQEALRESIAMGADEGILISDREMAGADTLATSYTLWKGLLKVAETRPIDLILNGKVAIDGETGQVPPGVAVRLGIPIVTNVVSIENLDWEKRQITVKRRFEDGVEIVRTVLPAALTIHEDANRARRSTIDGILKARRTPLHVWDKKAIDADSTLIGLKGSPTIVMKIFPPPGRKQGEIFDGTQDPKAAAEWLTEKLVHIGALGKQPRAKIQATPPATANPVSSTQTGLSQAQAKLLERGKGTQEFGDVWVYVEQIFGRPNQASWELLGEGKRLAGIYETKLAAVVVGHRVDHLIDESFAYGADKVYAIDHRSLERYRTEPYAEAVAQLSKKYKPEAILVGGTWRGRDMAGAAATILETGLIADCTALDVDIKTGTFLGTRPDYGGNLMSTIICPKHRPTMVTVRPRVMKALPIDPTKKGEVVREELQSDPEKIKTELMEWIPIEKVGVKLDEADIIVAGGKGLGAGRNFELVQDLAYALGGKVAASRAAVTAGWIPYEHQVGQTGVTVRPRLYFAIGISGAIQHIVGIMNADLIIAVNKDSEASIFKMSDFGIVGDLFKIVPAILEELKKRGLARTEQVAVSAGRS
jgi:electron transfer flavoprotein alpha subunit